MRLGLKGTAIVTGASAGIGEEFAVQLSRQGLDLVLTARRHDRLVELGRRLERENGISVNVIAADLANRGDLERLAGEVSSIGDVVVLVNNAGFGISGEYREQPVDRHLQMVDVHIGATVRLTHAVLPGMIQRGLGYIINVSSIAAFIPVGGGPGYSASKSYLNSYSTNLDSQVSRLGVRVQALCPGYTYTEFHITPEYAGNEREVLPKWVWMTSEEVVRYSLSCLGNRKVVVIPGWKNRVVSAVLRSSLATWLMSWRSLLMGKG